MNNVKLYVGDALERLKEIPDSSIDSIITDPPYEIGYAKHSGHSWDNSGIAFKVELWAEAFRVLKPGGHLLSFGATRTWHRMAVAVEDAGFEIRDGIAWIYSQGMPKNLDIAKQIDKSNGKAGQEHKFTEWMRTTSITGNQLDALTGTNMGSHYRSAGQQPSIPTPDLFDMIRPELELRAITVPAWVEELVNERGKNSKSFQAREVIGEMKSHTNSFISNTTGAQAQAVTLKITAAKTPEAQKWEGWGTALKPNFEPVVVARKPLASLKVADNVLVHGTGALNIAANRYDFETLEKGRHPSNVILDPAAADMLGDNSRFFYVAKPMHGERPVVDGVAHPTVKPVKLMRRLIRLVTPPGGTVLDIFAGSGTTLEAAALEGFDSIGFELTEDYLPLIELRAKRSGFNIKIV